MNPKNSQTVEQAQQVIYNFFLVTVRLAAPAEALQEFRNLFIYFKDVRNSDVLEALADVITTLNEEEFSYTLQRCCYILINNWTVHNEHQNIQELIDTFTDPFIEEKGKIAKHKVLKEWIKNFTRSEAYQSLKLYAFRHSEVQKSWQTRYTSYLMASQHANVRNPSEQRQLANEFCKKLRYQFKFDLAMYTARVNSTTTSKPSKNPTTLGNEILHLVKVILVRKGKFNYRNLANIFLTRNKLVTFTTFKQELIDYLEFNSDDKDIVLAFHTVLVDKLRRFLTKYDDYTITPGLIHKTCKLIVSCLTIEEPSVEPTNLFHLLMQQGNPLFLVIILLKIILICEPTRSHLDVRIADLIRYYGNYEEDECSSFINFLDMLNVSLAIYAEDTNYELVKMTTNSPSYNSIPYNDMNKYRIFSQIKANPTLSV